MDDGFFLTLADHSFPGTTASGCLEAYHHWGRGKPHTFPRLVPAGNNGGQTQGDLPPPPKPGG